MMNLLNGLIMLHLKLLNLLREQLGKSAVRQKRNFNATVKPLSFNVGDLVWYFYPPKSRKLSTGWIGPFEVLDCFSHFVYRIKNVNTGNCRIAHVDHLRLYLMEDCDNLPNINADFPDNIAISNDDVQDVVIPVGVEPEVNLDLPVRDSDHQTVTRSGRTRRRPAYLDDFHT